jgi:hypothetical protein
MMGRQTFDSAVQLLRPHSAAVAEAYPQLRKVFDNAEGYDAAAAARHRAETRYDEEHHRSR